MHKTRPALLSLKLHNAIGLVTLVFSSLMVGCVDATPIVKATQPGRPEISITPTETATPSVSPTVQVGFQPLAVDGSSFYYYADGNHIQLIPSLKWVSVEFSSDDPMVQSTALQNYGAMVGPLDQGRQIPNPKLTLLPLQEGLTIQTLVDGINSLRANTASFLQVNPVFQTEDAEMTITNEFIATFPVGKSMEEIDAINSSYGVEIVEPILGQENTFVLRVSPPAKVDSLSMANLYQESGAAINAAPNFIRIK